jgi:anti-sigma factor RsiW
MQHLTEEQLVLHHYHDGDGAAEVEKHLASCAECRAQFETLRRVLALVDSMPIPERGEGYSEQVWTRLRWKLGSERRRLRHWQIGLAAAAMLAIAFISGILWHQRIATVPTMVHQSASNALVKTPADQAKPNQILLVVVSDHLDQSERMLMELTNADAKHSYDMTSESKRAEDLVASNRMYRLTAQQRGETRIASLLSDLEPVLLELAHAGQSLSPAELAALQKRIDDAGLLFKVRVVSAQTKGTDSL